MTKFVWMSDVHFVASGAVQGYDPRERLATARTYINTYHSDAAFCVITGDAVDRGTREDYRALSTALSEFRMPVFPIVGNHDDRDLMRSELALPGGTTPSFIQYDRLIGDALFLFLDSQKSGEDGGAFCEERAEWLSRKLSAHASVLAYLFMHHPPVPLGLPMQDQDRLDEGDAFLDVLSQHSNVAYLFLGHVHRPCTGTMSGIPFSTMSSVLYQAPAPWPDWTWSSFRPADEAPEIGIVQLDRAGVTVHYVHF